MRIWLGVIVLAVLSGCATSPISAEQASPVPSSRLYANQERTPGTAVLVVTRDKGFTGSACNTKLFIDGVLAGEIGAGESARFWVEPGAVILGAVGAGVCGGGLKEREVRLVAGKMSRYRISIDAAMSMDLSPTAF